MVVWHFYRGFDRVNEVVCGLYIVSGFISLGFDLLFCVAWFLIKAIRIILVPLVFGASIIPTQSIVLLTVILLSLSFSPFFILLSFLFESISSRSYFPFIWYFMLIWDFKVRPHFINAFALINKREERNGWTRTVLLKGHLFLLSFFVRDKCLFSLFLVLILSAADLFFPLRTIFSATYFFSAAHFFYGSSQFFPSLNCFYSSLFSVYLVFF